MSRASTPTATVTSAPDGMPPGVDVTLGVGIDAREMTASGYRLYLFYP